MKFFKGIFLNQLARAKNIGEGHELYFLFFRLSQISLFVGSLFMASVLFNFSFDEWPVIGNYVWRPYALFALSTVFWMLLAEFSLRKLDKNRIAGFYCGIILSVRLLVGWHFPLGVFGFYALLNSSAQAKFLNGAPPWVINLLTSCGINFTGKKDVI